MLPAPLASVASTVKVKATSWQRLTTHKTVMRFADLRQRALSLVLSGRQIVGHIFLPRRILFPLSRPIFPYPHISGALPLPHVYTFALSISFIQYHAKEINLRRLHGRDHRDARSEQGYIPVSGHLQRQLALSRNSIARRCQISPFMNIRR